MDTIRGKLIDLINELNKLLLKTSDSEEERKIRKIKRILFTLLDEVIKQDIDRGTNQFKESIASLKEAMEEAEKAKEGLKKIADAINKAVSAAKAIDKVVNTGIDLT